MIENLDPNFGTFVNNNPVNKRLKMLFNGDVIFIMGLKIIIIGKSIYINNCTANRTICQCVGEKYSPVPPNVMNLILGENRSNLYDLIKKSPV